MIRTLDISTSVEECTVLCEFEYDLGTINSQQARRPLLPLWQVIVIVARSCWLASRGFYATTTMTTRSLRATLNCGHFDCGWNRWCCFIASTFLFLFLYLRFFYVLCGTTTKTTGLWYFIVIVMAVGERWVADSEGYRHKHTHTNAYMYIYINMYIQTYTY